MTRYFGRVEYFNHWKSAYPGANELDVGKGFEDEGFFTVDDFFDNLDDVDLFVFPDCYDGDLQLHLRSLGKLVWGSGECERLELFRVETKELFKKIGLPVGPYEVIEGVDALKEWMQDPANDDCWIKVSQTRGDWETFHHLDWFRSQNRVAELINRIGSRARATTFCCEKPIKAKLEVGGDGPIVDGEEAKTFALYGYEMKDAGYWQAVVPVHMVPEPVRWTNERLKPIFKKYQYRGNWSSEIRVGADGKYYLIDPCCRCGSPPSSLYSELYSNWGEIIYYGAQGIVIEPNPVAKYGLEVMIHSSWSDHREVVLDYPKEMEQWLKITFAAKLDGVQSALPQDMDKACIGSLVAIDDTMMGCVKKMVEYSKKIKAYSIDIKMDSIAEAMVEIRNAEKDYGYRFGTGTLPTPEMVTKEVLK